MQRVKINILFFFLALMNIQVKSMKINLKKKKRIRRLTVLIDSTQKIVEENKRIWQ